MGNVTKRRCIECSMDSLKTAPLGYYPPPAGNNLYQHYECENCDAVIVVERTSAGKEVSCSVYRYGKLGALNKPQITSPFGECSAKELDEILIGVTLLEEIPLVKGYLVNLRKDVEVAMDRLHG